MTTAYFIYHTSQSSTNLSLYNTHYPHQLFYTKILISHTQNKTIIPKLKHKNGNIANVNNLRKTRIGCQLFSMYLH